MVPESWKNYYKKYLNSETKASEKLRKCIYPEKRK